MSGVVIFVLVGQCGNQLGESILTRMFESVDLGRTPSPFFGRDGKARCVLVDSEPKAITGVLERSEQRFGALGRQFQSGGIFRKENVVSGESGRGNNWGLGYHGLSTRRPLTQRAFTEYKDQRVGDSQLLERALCAIHAEGCRVAGGDGIEAIIVVHSLAGGTGSGFTSKLVEKLNLHFQLRTPVSEMMGGIRPSKQPRSKYEELDEEDEIQTRKNNPWLLGKVVSDQEAREWETEEINNRDKDGLGSIYGERRKASYIVAFSVSPMKIGENAVQGINATLTLNSLFQSCHCTFLFRNDDALFNLPTPLTLPSGEDASTRSTGAGARRAAPSSTAGTIFKAPTTMEDINNVFASMVLVMFEFGRVFGTVHTVIQSTVPRAVNPGDMPPSGPPILTMVPLPQRVFSKYAHCAHFSRLYRLPTDMFGSHLAPDFDSSYVSGAAVVPIEQIHIQQKPPQFNRGINRAGVGARGVASQVSKELASDINVPVPRCLFAMGKNRASASSSSQSPDASYTLSSPLALWPVLVIAQLHELNREVAFPLLSDCFMKVKESAFIHLFEDTGVTPQFIEAALNNVAKILATDELLTP